jgi:hypothetical protein
MRAWMLAAVLVVTGCKGPTGPQGPAGPEGPKGDSTQGGAMMWVDATGSLVGPASDPKVPEYVDAQGVIWALDVETARVGHLPSAGPGFDGDGCSGTSTWLFPSDAQPMVAHMTLGGGFVSRKATGAGRSISDVSARLPDGSCMHDTGYTYRGLAGAEIDVPQAPTLAFAPPLHRERR